MDKQKIIAVCGPTASGKSALALALSHAFGGEMVSADSMQVYRGLSIGTAALSEREAEGVPQHLTGFLPPEQGFSVAEWVGHATRAVEDILQRGRLPVLCGGTGLYLQSLLQGTDFDAACGDVRVRAALEAEWDASGGAAMLEKLRAVDFTHAETLHAADRKRVLRSLELYTVTHKTCEERNAAQNRGAPPYEALCLYLDFADRAELYRRIDARVDAMLSQGLLQEARCVYDNRARYKTAAQAIGYKEFFAYFEGAQSLEECTAALKQATRRYAKRQMTWFRRMPGCVHLDAAAPGLVQSAAARVADFLHGPLDTGAIME